MNSNIEGSVSADAGNRAIGDAPYDCRSCGACCAYSAAWPRFSTEDDAWLDAIPDGLVANDGAGMRCENDRCAALTGEVGREAACSIYAIRPEVCRTCMPGDPECITARQRHGLPRQV